MYQKNANTTESEYLDWKIIPTGASAVKKPSYNLIKKNLIPLTKCIGILIINIPVKKR